MGENSRIEWTDHTFNPWVGCSKISPACDHCYAESWALRAGSPELWNGERRRTSVSNWRKPIQWNARAAKLGVRYRVFCASLADVFDNAVPTQWRDDLWELIQATTHLDWLLLTKRIGNAKAMIPWNEFGPWPNVWIGATVVTQAEVQRDVPKLLQTPACVRFLSCEPLLERLDLAVYLGTRRAETQLSEHVSYGVDWVICGGESGSKARPMDPAWCDEIRQDCKHTGAAFFMKQGSSFNWDDFKNVESFPPKLRVREFPR